MHNECCEVSGYSDDIVEFMDNFEELLGDSFSEIYSRLDEFNMNDEFFWFDSYGNINSDDIDDAKVDWDAILDGSLSQDIYEIVENI